MNAKVRTRIKRMLSKVIPDSSGLRYLSYLPKLESWRKTHVENCPRFGSRFELYDYLNADILANGAIDFLEFGVFKGDSIKYWATLNIHRESRFYGFDTFSGLPENWRCFAATTNRGTFDTGGMTPNLEDERVSFIKGLFQDTLPPFLKTHALASQLVIHNDSDLYSSTLYVLTRCNDVLVPGSMVILDEFSSMLHEFRALEDYCSSYMRDYEVLGVTRLPTDYYPQIAIRMK